MKIIIALKITAFQTKKKIIYKPKRIQQALLVVSFFVIKAVQNPSAGELLFVTSLTSWQFMHSILHSGMLDTFISSKFSNFVLSKTNFSRLRDSISVVFSYPSRAISVQFFIFTVSFSSGGFVVREVSESPLKTQPSKVILSRGLLRHQM